MDNLFLIRRFIMKKFLAIVATGSLLIGSAVFAADYSSTNKSDNMTTGQMSDKTVIFCNVNQPLNLEIKAKVGNQKIEGTVLCSANQRLSLNDIRDKAQINQNQGQNNSD